MNNPSRSRASAINEKCKSCIYDPVAAGTWREQVAACESGNCPLFSVRPVPRSCIANGSYDRAAINAVRTKLELRDRARAAV